MFEYFGKLYNLVIYVQVSPQHCEKFKVFTDKFNLYCDNAMWWNF